MINQNELLEMFQYYNGKLIRRKTTSHNARAGEIAGTTRKDGRQQVYIQGKLYFVHQLVWLWNTGAWVIGLDHIDRNPSNNRLENLRPATPSTNKANVGLTRANQSGYRGVSRDKRRGWQCKIKIDGKDFYLGSFDCPMIAAHVWDRHAKRLFGEFACLNFR